ncbi:MAG: hypothetical protein NC344_05805 [Bacteroidales bacterium]|nr:hypothetical protein [Bacteroidales bacterium]MCM1147334.1 hypothetical protein [Bacteroidales bacterium]MCM1206231.1 hypothetical protein [Bacillota bacterium]
MELKEFIKAAVSDITNAVSELQAELDNGAIVNPTLPKGEYGKHLMVNNEIREIERLNFDVAVTVAESTGQESGVKGGISILGAKTGSESSTKAENVSRLTFSVPVVLPSEHVKTPQEHQKDNRPKRPVF